MANYIILTVSKSTQTIGVSMQQVKPSINSSNLGHSKGVNGVVTFQDDLLPSLQVLMFIDKK